MADYKPIPLDAPKDGCRDKATFTISKRRVLLYVSILFNVLSVGFIMGRSHGLKLFSHGIFGQEKQSHTPTAINDDSDKTSYCASSLPPRALPPVPVNLWAPLTIQETSAIYTWLEAPERNLNLTRSGDTIVNDNVVFGIETYYPPKSEALAYLENSAASPPPPRFARVTIHHGGVQVPAVVDYLVGPLPVGPRTSIRLLKEIYHRDDIPFNARGFGDIEAYSLQLARMVAPISHAMEVSTPSLLSLLALFLKTIPSTQELFGGVVRGYENDTLIAGPTGPFGYDGSFRRVWITWRRNTAGSFILPVDFYTYIDLSGTDSSQWKILKVSFSFFLIHDSVF